MKRNLLILFWASFFWVACGQSGENSDYFPEPAMDAPELAQADLADSRLEARAYDQSEDGAPDEPGYSADPPETTEKKVIRTADIQMEVEDYQEGRAAVGTLVTRYQAEITSEEEEKLTYRIQNRLIVRLAPERLDSFLLALEGLAFHVAAKSIRAEDVTRQYVDLETRLSAKRATVERYREILRTARSVPDVLAVEEKMRQVIEDIESTERQLRFLSGQVRQSTVNLLLYEEFEQPEIRRRSFVQRLGNAFGDGWQVFLSILVGLASIWPVVLILVVLIWWVIRRARRGKRG